MKKFFTAVALATLGIAALPFEAVARSNHSHHYQLAETLVRTGINLRINPRDCDRREGVLGWYQPSTSQVVICQENKIAGSTRELMWTEEDYDTLRHEAHHVVQDCMARGRRDGHLGSVYEDPIEMGKSILGTSNMQRIANAYRSEGASDHTVVMEIEAFSVAAMNDPLEQVSDIRNFCM